MAEAKMLEEHLSLDFTWLPSCGMLMWYPLCVRWRNGEKNLSALVNRGVANHMIRGPSFMTLSKPSYPQRLSLWMPSHWKPWLPWVTLMGKHYTVEFLAGWRDGCHIVGKDSWWGWYCWTYLLLMVGGVVGVVWVQGCKISTMYSGCRSNIAKIIWLTVIERMNTLKIYFFCRKTDSSGKVI